MEKWNGTSREGRTQGRPCGPPETRRADLRMDRLAYGPALRSGSSRRPAHTRGRTPAARCGVRAARPSARHAAVADLADQHEQVFGRPLEASGRPWVRRASSTLGPAIRAWPMASSCRCPPDKVAPGPCGAAPATGNAPSRRACAPRASPSPGSCPWSGSPGPDNSPEDIALPAAQHPGRHAPAHTATGEPCPGRRAAPARQPAAAAPPAV